ncbi:MAG: GNAT family N-acetyltransferase [Fibrobacterota bacterium]
MLKTESYTEQLSMVRPTLDDLHWIPRLPDEWNLQKAGQGHRKGIADLLAAVFSGLTWTQEEVDAKLLKAPDVPETVVVTATDGSVAATASLQVNAVHPGMAVLHWVASHPNHRGKQLGSIVTLAVLYAGRNRGMKGSFLLTDDFRLPAIRTYLKLGYLPVTRSDPALETRWDQVYASLGLIRKQVPAPHLINP